MKYFQLETPSPRYRPALPAPLCGGKLISDISKLQDTDSQGPANNFTQNFINELELLTAQHSSVSQQELRMRIQIVVCLV